MADDTEFLLISPRLSLNPVCNSAVSPSPGSQGTPIASGCITLGQQWHDAVLLAIRIVGINIIVAHCHHGISPADNRLQRPSANLCTPVKLGVALIDIIFKIRRVKHPIVLCHTVVSLEIVSHENRSFRLTVVGYIDQSQCFQRLSLGRKRKHYLLGCSQSVYSLGILCHNFVAYSNLALSHISIHLLTEKFQKFGTAFLLPSLNRRNAGAVCTSKHIRQNIIGYFGFIIIDRTRISGQNKR